MKILITGSSGMLGSDLCDALGREHEIAGLDINEASRGMGHGSCEHFYKADILNCKVISEIIEREKPDLVIHAAAWTDVDGCEQDPEKAGRINTFGTENVAKASASTGVPLMFISTDYVFDGDKKKPYIENDKTNPLNVYGKTKQKAEEIISKIMSRYVVVRTSWLFGRNGKNFVDTIISKAEKEGALKVVDDQVGTPTYTKDLATALKALIGSIEPAGKETVHITNSGRCSWYEFAVRILQERGLKDVKVIPIKSSECSRPARRPSFSVLDNKKFLKMTGHRIRDWSEAVKEYINYEKI